MDFKQFYKKINFDIDNEIRTVYQVTQGDTKSRGLLVDLIVGGVKTPVTTETMNFFALKPDGTRVMTAGVKDSTGFRIDFTNQTFAVPGTLLCALVLYGTNGEKIADKKFKMTVDTSLEDGAIISKDERGILDWAFEFAESTAPYLEDIRAEEEARELAEDIRVQAEQGRAAALDAAMMETNQRIDNLVTTPVPTGEIIAEEIIDARQGKGSLGANITEVKSQLAHKEEKSFYGSMVNHKKSKGMITWIDDDANRGVYTRLRPLALEYGITFTSSVITDRPHGFPGDERPWNNAYIKYEEMVQMHNEGSAEFVSHSHEHKNLTTLTPEQLHQDMKKSQDILKQFGFNHRVFVYPFGGENATVHDIARQYFDCAIDVYNEGGPVGSYVKKPMNQFNINRMNVEETTRITEIYDVIDEAAANDEWLVIISHIDSGGWYSEAYVRGVIERALNKGLEFVTVDDALKKHGNLAQYGNTTISNDGTVYGGFEYNALNQIPLDAPVTAYPQPSTTKSRVRYADSPVLELGVQTGGEVETNRHVDDMYSYQKFTPLLVNFVLYRRWLTETNTWGSWTDAQNLQYINIPLRDNVPALQKGRMYYNEVDNAIKWYDGTRWETFNRVRSGTFTSSEVAGQAVTISYDQRLDYIPSAVILTPKGVEELGVTFTVTSIGAWNFSVRCSKPSIEFSYIAI